MNERRGHWYLITGLILGAVLGLAYSWLVNPIHYTETAPYSLKTEFKEGYRTLIAAAYTADGDINRAKARLALLRDPDPAQALAAQAQQVLAQGGSQSDARQLAILAQALANLPTQGVPTTPLPATPTTTITNTGTSSLSSVQASPTGTSTPRPTLTFTPGMTSIVFTASPSPTLQPTVNKSITPTRQTGTPLATPTSTPTLGAPFAMKERSQVCDQSLAQPWLQVQLNDAAGNPVPGVEVLVSWQDGQDTFYTGFMPEINAGFANFQLTPGLVYTVHLTDGGQAVNDLAAISCSGSNGQPYWGGWYLLFQQP